MPAGAGRCLTHASGRTGHEERQADLPDPTDPRLLHLDRHLDVAKLVVEERLLRGVDRQRESTQAENLLHPPVERLLGEAPTHRWLPRSHRRQVAYLTHAGQLLPRRAIANDRHHVDPPAIGASVDVGLEHAIEEQIRGVLLVRNDPCPGVHRLHSLEERRLDCLTEPGPLARVERRCDAEDRLKGRAVTRLVRCDEGRLRRRTGDRRLLSTEAGPRRDEQIPAGTLGVGMARRVTADAAHDEPWIALRELFASEPEPDRGRVRQAFQDDVGPLDETLELRAVGGVDEIEHDAATAAQPDDVSRDLPATGIATRWLDLDHVGAVVGEQHPGDWPWHPARQIEDPDSVQSLRHRVSDVRAVRQLTRPIAGRPRAR
jgi:hypothetical protein